MSYVIRRSARDGGGYVARPGSRSSYTMVKANARHFRTREEAERDRCPGNETIEEA